MERRLTFTAYDAGEPGSPAWTERARERWPQVTSLLTDATWTPEGQAAAMDMVAEHMPELIPVLDALAAALDQPGGAACLTGVTLKPFFEFCSQTSVAGALVRNYDFDPQYCERVVCRSSYLRPVIGMQELFWGLLDGMNDAGLAVSLTFGGRLVKGPGFSVLMVIRYLLETCMSVEQAWQKLRTLPVCTAQNLTLVDRDQALSVYIGPDMAVARAEDVCVTNHQHAAVPDEQERDTRTRERLAAIRAAKAQADAGLAPDPVETIVQALLKPPLYQFDPDSGHGTLYTAAYRPAEGRVSYIWPAERWEQSFADFRPGIRTINGSGAVG